MTAHRKYRETASQTAGPYLHIGCMPNSSGINGVFAHDLGAVQIGDATEGIRIALCGTVFDASGAAMTDAMIEIWQADASGRYGTSGGGDGQFCGFGRQACDPNTGEWRFETIKPGKVPFSDGRMMAPHVLIWIAARGINIGLQTRLYFPDEEEANAADPVLQHISPRSRIKTLVAQKENDRMYRLNIHLQGADETVFFDV
jgi:protocatechuate 3,4-dioxygenase alpha subunit